MFSNPNDLSTRFSEHLSVEQQSIGLCRQPVVFSFEGSHGLRTSTSPIIGPALAERAYLLHMFRNCQEPEGHR